MIKVCVFSGTTEGRIIAGYLDLKCKLYVCVATKYGELIDETKNAVVSAKRMDEEAVFGYLKENSIDIVIDATHPYAKIITENVRYACEKLNIEYIRIKRYLGEKIEDAVYVDSALKAADILKNEFGNIFLTTGVKELKAFDVIDRERLYVRVTPSIEALSICNECNIASSNIIAALGPFSKETNIANFRSSASKWLVTKQSGKNGGFEEKINAAKDLNMKIIVIKGEDIKTENEGMSVEECMKYMSSKISVKKDIYIIGCGAGVLNTLTMEAYETVIASEILIGSKRLINNLGKINEKATKLVELNSKKIYNAVISSNYNRIGVLVSGDINFYSLKESLVKEIDNDKVNLHLIPGLSSVAMLCAKVNQSWQDMAFVSMHGRDADIVKTVKANPKVFVLNDPENTPSRIINILNQSGLKNLYFYIGCNLYMEDETIIEGNYEELSKKEFPDKMSCMIIVKG